MTSEDTESRLGRTAAKLSPLASGGVRENSDEKFDLNGDGKADLCGRGELGIYCALSNSATGTSPSFGPLTLWNDNFSDGYLWNDENNYVTIRYPDLDGDGMADVCGRGDEGIWCGFNILNTATGAREFGGMRMGTLAFSDLPAFRGSDPASYSTIRYPDIDGDKKADLCGVQRPSVDGVVSSAIYCGVNQLAGTFLFDPLARMDSRDPVAGINEMPVSWGDRPAEYATVRFPDLNGDGRADMCARGENGIYCGLKSQTVMTFLPIRLWQNAFGDMNGWGEEPYYSTISYPDLNGDGKADICGRSLAGVFCALSDGSGFGPLTQWAPAFGDFNDWSASAAYFTIAFPDVNGDGKADVCGRRHDGVYCGLSTGDTFGDSVVLRNSGFNDAERWGDGAQYYSTIMFRDLDGDGKADVCGRGLSGIVCALYVPSVPSPAGPAGMFAPLSLVEPNFSDAYGWVSPQYFRTLRMQ